MRVMMVARLVVGLQETVEKVAAMVARMGALVAVLRAVAAAEAAAVTGRGRVEEGLKAEAQQVAVAMVALAMLTVAAQ